MNLSEAVLFLHPQLWGYAAHSRLSSRAGLRVMGAWQVAVREGKLHVEKEGTVRKFRKQVFEKTFAAASSEGRSIMYITERAVLKLQGPSGGLELLEIAPGIDLDRDVLGQMDFQPIMKTSPLKLMDVRCFQP